MTLSFVLMCSLFQKLTKLTAVVPFLLSLSVPTAETSLPPLGWKICRVSKWYRQQEIIYSRSLREGSRKTEQYTVHMDTSMITECCKSVYQYFAVLCSMPSYNSSTRTTRKTRVTCQVCAFIGSLHSNGDPSIAESVSSGMGLPRRCVAMDVYVTMYILFWVPMCGRILNTLLPCTFLMEPRKL
jgi:hypothetical protein